jgi:hypothetical protein
MVCISKSEHSTLTATDQFDHASKEAKEFWLEHQCSADTLKTMFGLSRSTAYRWIQRWT